MHLSVDTPDEIRRIIEELHDPDDIGAFWISDDRKRLTINAYIDGGISAQTYVMNEETGHYDLVAYNGLSRAKTDGG